MLVLQCDCGKILEVPASAPARRGVCPHCGQTLQLPEMASSAALDPRRVGNLRGHRLPVRHAAFSPDGRMLLTTGGSDNGAAPQPPSAEIRIWDVSRQRTLAAMQGHQDAVLCGAFTPDSQTLVTGSRDGTLIVWDVSRGMHDVVLGLKEHTLRGHGGAVTAATISPDGQQMVTASDHGEIRIWDTGTWRCQNQITTGRSGQCRLVHSPQGEFLAAVWDSPGPALVWHAAMMEEYIRLSLRPDEDCEDYSLCFSPDEAFLAISSADLVRIWDLASCQVVLAIDIGGVRCLAYAPNGKMLAGGGWDIKSKFDVHLWDPQSGESLGRLGGQRDSLYATCFSPQGDRLACAGRDLLVHVWEL